MEVSIREASELLEHYIEENVPAFMWGPPGVGKSDSVRQIVAKRKKWGMVDFRACLRDPVDIRGLPTVDIEKRRSVWLSPDELPDEKRDGKYGILFMDELNTASPAVMNACLGLVLDRRVAQYTLPEGWRIVAAGNRTGDRAAVNKMPRPLAARFAHVKVVADLDATLEWMIDNDIHEFVTSYLRFRPGHLYTLEGTDDLSFPNPRNWARVSKFCEKSDSVRLKLISGIIGDGPAAEFNAFMLTFRDLPTLDEILESPKKATVPNDPSGKYAVSGMLSRRVKRNTFGQALTYANRLGREFEIVTVLDATRRDSSLCDTKAFVEFQMRNKDVTLPQRAA